MSPTSTSRFFEFVMTPNSNIIGGTNKYELILTSAIPYPMTSGSTIQVHGVIFPSEPYSYKLEMATCNSCSSPTTGYLAWQHAYFPIYGVPFTNFELVSFIAIAGEWNIFTIDITLSQAVVYDE